VHLLRHEDLVHDADAEIGRLLRFLGLPRTPEIDRFLRVGHSGGLDANRSGGWHTALTAEEARTVVDVAGPLLARLGYDTGGRPPAVRTPRRARPFLVAFTGNSGSTYLTHLLRQHPDVEVKGEILARMTTAGEQREFLDRFYGGADGTRAVGLKAKLTQFHDRDDVRDALVRHGAAVFHLVRENSLKQVVARLRARELAQRTQALTGSARANLRRSALDAHPELALGRLAIDVDALRRQLVAHERREAELRDFLGGLEGVVRISYEELLRDRDGFLAGVHAHIGVPFDAVDDPEVVKKTSDDLREAIANFDEVAAALAGTPYEPMLFERPV
jgi:LPS sulfotransferase NodH